MRIAAIDQGTTSTRLLVIEHDGSAVIGKGAKHSQHFPRSGWVEHDPLELLAHVKSCLAAAGRVDAVGIDNQGESCLAWDRVTGEPLSPVIVWQDNRTADRVAHLKATGCEPEVLARAGLPLDAYFSATKLAWLVREVPAVRAAAAAGRACLGTTDAFFLQHLTGRCVTDVTTASRTALMNIETLAWDPALCRLFEVPLDALPPIATTVGEFGLADGIPVTCSVVDQQAALYGHGCRRAGDVKVTFGTGAFALALTGNHIVRGAERGLLPTVAWSLGGAVTRAVDGGVYDAGAAVEWAGRIGLFSHFDELMHFDAEPAIGRGLVFVPALSGLACPHWDRSAAALWLGMSAGTTRHDLCQALLEGVALRTEEVIETLDAEVSLAETISIDGGLAANPYFVQFLADVLQRAVRTCSLGELTAAGTAALAAQGLGHELKISAGDDKVFAPREVPAAAWRARFREAVSRSRAWR